MNPHVLVAPRIGKSFPLYVLAMHHFLGTLLAQYNDEGHNKAIYYLSINMIDAES